MPFSPTIEDCRLEKIALLRLYTRREHKFEEI